MRLRIISYMCLCYQSRINVYLTIFAFMIVCMYVLVCMYISIICVYVYRLALRVNPHLSMATSTNASLSTIVAG